MLNLRDYQQQSVDAIRACVKCGEHKPCEQFYKRENGRLRTWCKSCWNEKNKNWNKQNPDRRKATLKKWQDKNPENLRSRKAAYRARHPIHYRKWSIDNPEKKKELNRLWAANNRPRRAATAAKRRATKRNATPIWANESVIFALYKQASMLGMEIDHIVPLQSKIVCGLHCEHNFQLLPISENRRKSNRHWPDMP